MIVFENIMIMNEKGVSTLLNNIHEIKGEPSTEPQFLKASQIVRSPHIRSSPAPQQTGILPCLHKGDSSPAGDKRLSMAEIEVETVTVAEVNCQRVVWAGGRGRRSR
ncbi:polyketide cyclase/dehydrase and lipid transportsuperfamily protein [Striga asiatica]|uniref:Polyketide cyclase/dehydrase and lipid transportsuperfamily protein n=1 Tax=Striga asiatica TaxID=4170 RepID=A0A5A7Q5F6_STRAF|nr:polyketide cyclase/dehydrase and lipid transportsuperfamily protein [Striga asiatica]